MAAGGPARLLLRLLAASAAAAAGIGVSGQVRAVPAFPPPFPAAANTSLSHLHLLPALQCDTTAPGTLGGVRGFVLPAAAWGGGALTVPVGDATCWSPVTDAAARQSATGSRPGPGGPYVSVLPSSALKIPPAGNARTATWRLQTQPPAGRFVRDVSFSPALPGGARRDGGGEGQLLREAAALRLLTLQRNSLAGVVERAIGMYDVAAVTRLTMGFCRTPACHDISAVDVLGARRVDFYSNSAVPLLLYTPPDGTAADPSHRRHVSMDDEDLLSLGRAVVADPAWLPAAVALSWRLRAWLSLRGGHFVDVAGTATQTVNAIAANRGWGLPMDLGNTSAMNIARTSRWLQVVAHTLCATPRASFVMAAKGNRLCGSAQGASPSAPSATGALVMPMYQAKWMFDPDQYESSGEERPPEPPLPPKDRLPLCNLTADRDVVHLERPVTRPAWLVGRAEREINPAADDEVALARSISTCSHQVNASDGDGAPPFRRLDRINSFQNAQFRPIRAQVRRLSQAYDKEKWGVQPPIEPASDADITLSAIVVLPEVMAMLALLLTNPRWARKEWLAFLFIWVAGGVSTAGILALAVGEVRGRGWRAATVRTEWSVRLHGSSSATVLSRRLDGMPLYKTETLYLAARLGYRDRLLVWLASGITLFYVVVSVGVAAAAARRSLAGRRDPGGESAAEAGITGDGVPRTPLRVRILRPRTLMRSRPAAAPDATAMTEADAPTAWD